MTIIEKHPKELRPHPAIARMHRWGKDHDEFTGFCRLLREQGILDPLKITGGDLVVDGEMRRQAAVRLGLEAVPCVVVPDDHVSGIVVATLLGRRHYTSGQRAYMIQDQMKSAWEEARANEHGKLRKGQCSSAPVSDRSGSDMGGTDPSLRSVEAWGEALGVHIDTLRMAREIRAKFDEHKGEKFPWDDDQLAAYGFGPGVLLTLEEYFEAAMFHPENPMGLGSIKKGIGGKLEVERMKGLGYVHPGRHSVDGKRQLQLFGEAVELTFGIRAKEYWPKMDEEGRKLALAKVSRTMTDTPEDLLKAIMKAAAAELKRRQNGEE